MRYVLVVVGLLLIIGGLGGVKFAQIQQLIAYGTAAAAAGPPPEAVATFKAQEMAWESTLTAIGTVAASRGVTVTVEVGGQVKAIKFDSGATVKQGQVLLELDSSVERAQLASSVARRELAQIQVKRTRSLVEQNAITQAQLDTDEANLKSTAADVAALQAQIAKKTVRAPFDGRLGIRQVNLGQYMNPGDPIAVLQATDNLFVDFTVPQTQLGKLALGTAVRIDAAAAGRSEGIIAAIAPSLDAGTRAVNVRASLSAKENQLRVGMFVDISIVLPEQQKVVVVPATAIVRASFGDSVYLVEPAKDKEGKPVTGMDGKPGLAARQQFVKLGASRGDFVAIADGVKAGQEVVAAGAFKLRNGSAVIVNPSVKVDYKVDPKPENR